MEQARQHNDMNVLCIGADYTDFDTAKYMIEAFFKTKFLKGRHTRRIEKLDEDTNTNWTNLQKTRQLLAQVFQQKASGKNTQGSLH